MTKGRNNQSIIEEVELSQFLVGLGLYLGRVLEGVGALVGLIGIGQLIAGYLYPNTGSELTDAVDNFEKK